MAQLAGDLYREISFECTVRDSAGMLLLVRRCDMLFQLDSPDEIIWRSQIAALTCLKS